MFGICYAALKERTGGSYTPARAGQINDETRFVLEHFAVPVPRLMETVETQVGDIQIRRIKGVRRGISIKPAWNLMQENDIYTVPVVSSKRCSGGVDHRRRHRQVLYERVRQPYPCPRPIPSMPTSWRPCREPPSGGLRGAFFPGQGPGGGAANPDVLENYIEKGDLVILGNRYESQLCAIEMEAGCIVVCEGAGSP